jgi:hypothetical protein
MNTTTEIATRDNASILEQVVVGGDLSKLTARQRLDYYSAVCESVGLNPLTRPFSYLTLSGRLVLYAGKEATDALRKKNEISVKIVSREQVEDIWIVTAQGTTPLGRTDESIGAVSIGGLRGEQKAHALMKCETKAKRRVTLSICGLGMLDESEVESIPDARPADVTPDGEVVESPTVQADAAVAQDREQLMGMLKEASATLGLKAPERAALWEKHCRGSAPDTVDIAALTDLVLEVRGRLPKETPA